MIMSAKEIALAKVRRLQNGYSAFAESNEMIRLIKRECKKLNVDVQIDETHLGSWFIPTKQNEKSLRV